MDRETYAEQGGYREVVRLAVYLGKRPDVVEVKVFDNRQFHLDREAAPGRSGASGEHGVA